MKETFENIEVQIITIVSEDVIATSGLTAVTYSPFSTGAGVSEPGNFGGNNL